MNWKKQENQKLLESFLSLKNKKETANFLRDLMTEAEIEEFAKRLKTAEMLTDKISYINITKETGLSSTTVARVAKWLNGPEKGYQTILKRVHHNKPAPLRRGLS
ncbi:MAG: YerC/YecD family TrpR-related protein [Patescibacteria group bacterium]